MTKVTTRGPLAGDHVEVVGHRVGDTPRSGAIVEVLGTPPHQHFRVRWEDEHVSVLYPGTDVVVTPATAPSSRRTRPPRARPS